MKLPILLIYVGLFSIFFSLAKNILTIFGYVDMSNLRNLWYSVATFFLLAFIYKHRYWVTACLFIAASELIKMLLPEGVITKSVPSNKLEAVPVLIMIGSIFFLLISLFCIVRFWKFKNYSDYYLFK